MPASTHPPHHHCRHPIQPPFSTALPPRQPDFRLVVDRPLAERPRQNKWILGAWLLLAALGAANMLDKVPLLFVVVCLLSAVLGVLGVLGCSCAAAGVWMRQGWAGLACFPLLPSTLSRSALPPSRCCHPPQATLSRLALPIHPPCS